MQTNIQQKKHKREQFATFSRTNKIPNANVNSISFGHVAFVHITLWKGMGVLFFLLSFFSFSHFCIECYGGDFVLLDSVSDEEDSEFAGISYSFSGKHTKCSLFTCKMFFFSLRLPCQSFSYLSILWNLIRILVFSPSSSFLCSLAFTDEKKMYR